MRSEGPFVICINIPMNGSLVRFCKSPFNTHPHQNQFIYYIGMSLETNWWLLWKELARAWEKKSGLLSIKSESWQYAILVGFRSDKQPCLEIYSVHVEMHRSALEIQRFNWYSISKYKIQFVFNIRFNNQLLFTCSPFMHNMITRLNWWSG